MDCTDSTNHDQPPTSNENIAKRIRSQSSRPRKSSEEELPYNLPRKTDKNRKPSHEKPSKELLKKLKQKFKVHRDDDESAAQDTAVIMASQEAALRSFNTTTPAMSSQSVLACAGVASSTSR